MGSRSAARPATARRRACRWSKAGANIRYTGITLGLGGFTDAGEPSATTYGILRFAAANQMDATQTQYVPTGNANKATTSTPPAPAGAGTGPLRIGALLPHTGDLASAGPPMFAGSLLAVAELNQAGGILDKPVEWVDGDDGTDQDKAKATVDRLINDEKVHVIIGAGASSITKAVLPAILAAGVVLFSPWNTAAELTTAADQGLYFRTAPPDGLQAGALTDIIMRDGVRRVAIIAREDAYGRGLLDSVKENLIAAGLSPDDVIDHPYNPDEPDFASIATAVKAFDPDGVLIIGFDETAEVIDSLFKEGLHLSPELISAIVGIAHGSPEQTKPSSGRRPPGLALPCEGPACHIRTGPPDYGSGQRERWASVSKPRSRHDTAGTSHPQRGRA